MTKFVTRYADIERMTPRRMARHAALDVLSAMARVNADEMLARPRVQFMHLHYVFDDEKDHFRELLADLARQHTFVSYSEGVQRVISGDIDRPYIAVSFDDGLKNCLAASRVLDEFGIPGMFFVCTSMVGVKDYDTIRAFCEERIHLPPLEFLDWDDLEDMRARGHEIGSHAVTHRRFADLSADEVTHEIHESCAVLKSRLGDVQHFAWPYGRFSDFPPGAADEVFKAGYVSCASGERGCHIAPSPTDPRQICLRREHVIARWPIRHIKYFLARSSRRVTPQRSLWPPTLAPR